MSVAQARNLGVIPDHFHLSQSPVKFIILISLNLCLFSTSSFSYLYCQNSLLTARWGLYLCLVSIHSPRNCSRNLLWTAWLWSSKALLTHKMQIQHGLAKFFLIWLCHLDFSSLSSHRGPWVLVSKIQSSTRHCVSFMTHLWPCLAKKIQ